MTNPRVPTDGKVTLTVAVDAWVVPVSVTGIDWFAPPSDSRYIVTVEVIGTLVAVITTGTGELEFMVASGKLNGLALMAMPPMLVTLMTGRGAVGRFRAKGTEVSSGPLPTLLLKLIVPASRRARPLPGAVRQLLPPPP